MFFKKVKGFSLVELMIVVAMLGGVSLGVMNITKQSRKSSSKLELDTDMTLSTNEINGILSDPIKCLAALGTSINPTNINGKFFTTASGSAPANGYGNSGFQITSYTVSGVAPDGVLTIAYTNKTILKGASGASTVPKKINLFIVGTPGAITNCHSLSSSSSDIWLRGSGANINDIYYNNGNVGIGTNSPATKLEVIGSIRPGSIAMPSSCSIKGAQGYDSNTGAPVYCNGTSWTAVGGSSPTGMIAYFTSSSCPAGWIAANGISGTIDLRGEFIRGLDSGRGIDAGRTLGSFQVGTGIGRWIYQGAFIQYQNVDSITAPGAGISRGGVAGYVSGQEFFTTRPRNIALLACQAL